MNMLETLKKFYPDLDFRSYIMANFEKQIDVKKLEVKNLEEFLDKLEIDDERFKNRILFSLAEFLEKENLNLKHQLKVQSNDFLLNQNKSNQFFSNGFLSSLSMETKTKETSLSGFEAKQSNLLRSDRKNKLFGGK